MSENAQVHSVGIIMNGVTGRMGTNQHLMRSIAAIREQGGVRVGEEEFIMPDPILVGRNPVKLRKRSEMSGVERWTTDLDSVLSNPEYPVYFDAQTTDRRADAVRKAVEAGKHIYVEKPTATNAREAWQIAELAEEAGVKNGVVMDKLWLPGFRKLQVLLESGFFGRILSLRGEFGYWVFEGDRISPQRPSWNYRKEDGGGIILDMFPHWSYILENLFGELKSVLCLGATHVKERWDENGDTYECTADDAAYAMFEIEGDIIAQFNSSWTTRVRRDDLVTIQVDGTEGSAVVGLRKCYTQSYGNTPKPVWNPDVETKKDYHDDWLPVPDQEEYENAFKTQWEKYLLHVVKDEPFPWSLREGAKGVQLAESGYNSWQEKRWVEL